MGPNNIVMGWTHDGKHIVFRSRMREWDDFIGQLYLASIEGGIPEELPLPRGGFCPSRRTTRSWLTTGSSGNSGPGNVTGAAADDIWIYDFKTKALENITNNPALDIIPMWTGNRIYFLSDRDENKRMNLHVYDLGTKETKKLTNFIEFDIKFPSLGPKAIVFENGDSFIASTSLGTHDKDPCHYRRRQAERARQIVKVEKDITDYGISPDGRCALFDAHGEIFVVPFQHGNIRNLTNTSGVHERDAVWCPTESSLPSFPTRAAPMKSAS